MRIAIVSGKGGTGKTLVATNLAAIAAENASVCLYDLDVEEPNDHLFFPFEPTATDPVSMMIPVVDEAACSYCGECTKVCEFHAIISLREEVMVFPELCHGCYSCLEMCPMGAISEGSKTIGEISKSGNERFSLIGGRLRISENVTTALIAGTKKAGAGSADLIIHDAPPGTSCPMIEAVRGADYAIVVAEPTPFGLHDMDLVVQTLQELQVPFGVVVNKAEDDNELIERFCTAHDVNIIGRIPWSVEIAQTYARGELISEKLPWTAPLFRSIYEEIFFHAQGVMS
jgi:MinD superfamily P-loop ATPase